MSNKIKDVLDPQDVEDIINESRKKKKQRRRSKTKYGDKLPDDHGE